MNAPILSQVEHGTAGYDETVALRNAVLREPLGMKLAEEELLRERSDFHLVCHADDQLVGCLVLTPLSDSDIKMKQVAVVPNLQRQGIGKALVQFAEKFSRQRGFSKMTLDARDTAISFYEKLAYRRVGEPFERVTISHWKMTKDL